MKVVPAIYRVTKFHEATRGGMNAAVDADIRGVAKTNDASRYTIANELIAARVGQTLGLPVPAGVTIEDETKKLYYVSLDVSYDGGKLPPIIAEDFIRDHPWLAAGCVLFDVLIANADRNGENVAVDPNFSPPRVTVLDHGHALFGTNEPIGPERLSNVADSLGCDNNALMDHVSDGAHLAEWAQRIGEIPRYVFDDICADVGRETRLNVSQEEAQHAASWLADRSQRVARLICDHKGSFPAVAQWCLVEEKPESEGPEQPEDPSETQDEKPSEADNGDRG